MAGGKRGELPRYPKYKDSGVEWLGEVPEHWGVGRLKNAIRERITDGPHITPKFVLEGVPFLSVDSIQNGEIVFEDCRFVSKEAHDEFVRKARPEQDDILMGKAASTGKIARVKTRHAFSIWSPLALLKVRKTKIEPQYLEFWLKSPLAQANIEVLCTSNTQKNISMDDIPKVPCCFPPLMEQHAISTFLDQETAKIDALIAEQERLIELLTEKRQAVISHAVTRGLNPDAPMKDSGIEWLGRVPAHWQVRKGAGVGRLFGSEQVAEELVGPEGNLPFIKVSSLTRDGFEVSLGDFFVSEVCASAVKTRDNFLVFPKRGAAIFTNKVGFVSCPAVIDPNLMGWQIYSPHHPHYFGYLLVARGLTDIADVSTVPQINNKHIGGARFPVPPPDEQEAIVEYARNTMAKIAEAITMARESTDLLRERRSALISAAVTGKIDVRGLVPALRELGTSVSEASLSQ